MRKGSSIRPSVRAPPVWVIFQWMVQGSRPGSALDELGVTQLADLKQLDNHQLLEASTDSRWAERSRIVVDGDVLPEPPRHRFENGTAMKIPLMVGSLANEGIGLIPLNEALDEMGFEKFLSSRFQT